MIKFKVDDKFVVKHKTFRPNSVFKVIEVMKDGIRCIDLKDEGITAIEILPQLFRDFQLEAMKEWIKKVK